MYSELLVDPILYQNLNHRVLALSLNKGISNQECIFGELHALLIQHKQLCELMKPW